MIKQFFMFIILSLSSLAALAVPTVTEVENTINSGDYAKAKTMLKEVLVAHPDSLVANRYMLEAIKIEYAGSLKPSVEYKVYEQNIQKIENDRREKAYQEMIRRQEAEKAATKEKIMTVLNWIFVTIIIALIVFIGLLIYRKKIKPERDRRKKEQLELLRKQEWLKQADEKFLKLNRFFSDILDDEVALTNFEHKYGRWAVDDLRALNADNIEASEAVSNNDYSEKIIDRHFENAFRNASKWGIYE